MVQIAGDLFDLIGDAGFEVIEEMIKVILKMYMIFERLQKGLNLLF